MFIKQQWIENKVIFTTYSTALYRRPVDIHSMSFNLCRQVPMARASILWLIGEYCEHVPKIAPDVLRKMAKSFTNEEDIVKLQIINLAAKLYLTNSKQVGNNVSPSLALKKVHFKYRHDQYMI